MREENIESKIQTIRSYIYEKKGFDIINIIVKTHDDLVNLNMAYMVAVNYFMNK